MNETPNTTKKQDADVPSQPQTSTPTVPHTEPRIGGVTISPVVISPGTPPDQITALMDMIHFHSEQIRSLQSQLLTVTTEMIRMRESGQTSKPAGESVIPVDTTYPTFQGSTVSTLPPPDTSSVLHETPKGPRNNKKNEPQQLPRKTTKKPSDQVKKSKSLIIGDSLIRNINEKGLNEGVHCYGISGATAEIISRRIQMFNLKEFSTVVISVGGNDSANKVDVEFFEAKLDEIIQYIKSCNPSCKIILCGICPRSDCDVTPYNELLHGLAAESRVQSVLMVQSFSDNNGQQVDRYFANDGIHFSPSGVRRFLDAIQKSCKVNLVSDFNLCAYVRHQRNLSNHSQRHRNSEDPKCFKCGETNHTTMRCRHRYRLRCHRCGSMGHKQSKCTNK